MGGDPYLTVKLIILASWCEKQERYCVVLVTSNGAFSSKNFHLEICDFLFGHMEH